MEDGAKPVMNLRIKTMTEEEITRPKSENYSDGFDGLRKYAIDLNKYINYLLSQPQPVSEEEINSKAIIGRVKERFNELKHKKRD